MHVVSVLIMFSTAWSLLAAGKNALLPQAFHFRLDYATSHSGTAALVDMLRDRCPSLGDHNVRASRMLPTGVLQTIYANASDMSAVDHVEYVRKVILTPDGGTLSLDITPPSLAEASDADVPTVLCLHGLTGGSGES